MNKKNNLSIVERCYIAFSVYIIIVLFCIYQDNYHFINFNKCYYNLTSKGSLSLEFMITLYFSIFTSFMGVYFTILAIFLSRKNVSFNSFFMYLCIPSRIFKVLLCFCIVNTLSIFLFIFFLEYTYFSQIFIICSIFKVSCLFLVGVLRMTYLEDYKKAIDITGEKIKYLLNMKSKKEITWFKNFFFNIIASAYPIEKYDILLSANSKIENKKNKYKQIFEIYYQVIKSIEIKKITNDEFKSFLEFFFKSISQLVYGEHSVKLDVAKKYYDLLFKVYREYIFTDKVERSYILEIRDTIYIKILQNKKEDYFKLYSYILSESAKIIYFSLYHVDYKVIRSEVQDFLDMIHLLGEYNENLSEKHDYLIVDIITKIINSIQIGRGSKLCLNLIPELLSYIKSIKIFDLDDRIYNDILTPAGLYEVKLDFNFYIALLLLYSDILKIYSSAEIIGKIKYIPYKHDLGYVGYQKIKDRINEITCKDINKFLDDNLNENDVNNHKNDIIKELDKYIEKIKDSMFEKLNKDNIEKELKDEIDKKICKIENDFKNLKSNNNNLSEFSEEKIKSTFYISYKELKGDRNVITFGSTYYDLIIEYFYNWYINTCEVIDINSLLDLDFLDSDNEHIIYLPRKYESFFYENKEVEFFQDGINVKNKNFKFKWIFTNSPLIVTQKNLISCCFFSRIEPHLDNISKKENKESLDIDYTVPFDFIFRINQNKKRIAYRLIM